MSYTKTNWHDGDTITAVKMNKIENGIESSLSDALVTLGKALCGDSFEVKPGLTDAETILEIAKNYEGGSGSGGSGTRLPEIVFQMDCTDLGNGASDPVFSILTPKQEVIDLAKRWSNCVVCLDVIGADNIPSTAAFSFQNGRNYGYICRLYYDLKASKVMGNPDEETLDMMVYMSPSKSAPDSVIHLCEYDSRDGQLDAWDFYGYLSQVMAVLLHMFSIDA